jgi:hypothetical protein
MFPVGAALLVSVNGTSTVPCLLVDACVCKDESDRIAKFCLCTWNGGISRHGGGSFPQKKRVLFEEQAQTAGASTTAYERNKCCPPGPLLTEPCGEQAKAITDSSDLIKHFPRLLYPST